MGEKYRSRGAKISPVNRFFKHTTAREHPEGIDLPGDDEKGRTKFLEVHPKTIVNKVPSPDVGMDYSLNPYQGCEHGCIYCYARNSHEYWGFSAGVEFEKNILVKKNAPKLLRKWFQKKNYKVQPVLLSGNTDCYQPAERKLKITRSLLKVFSEYRHPVGIITKNALVQRDTDILSEMALENLASVTLSVTTLNEDIRRKMEPRTATISQRLRTIEHLSNHGIPVRVMMAPIIPGLTSHEILPLVKAVANAGALGVGYTMVRLNGAIGEIFEDWVKKEFPDRANKVLSQIREVHGGSLNDSRFKTRMRGEGKIAEMVKNTMAIARKRYLPDAEMPQLDTTKFRRVDRGNQLNLF